MRKRKQQGLQKKYKLKNTYSKKITVRKPWIKKFFKYSNYPYLLIISCFRRNVFFTVTNFKGQTKQWTCSGRHSFSGKAKRAHLALVTVTDQFLKRIWIHGIHHLMIIFKNYTWHHSSIKRGIKLSLSKQYKIRFLSITFKTRIIFNGCRKKKRKRR